MSGAARRADKAWARAQRGCSSSSRGLRCWARCMFKQQQQPPGPPRSVMGPPFFGGGSSRFSPPCPASGRWEGGDPISFVQRRSHSLGAWSLGWAKGSLDLGAAGQRDSGSRGGASSALRRTGSWRWVMCVLITGWAGWPWAGAEGGGLARGLAAVVAAVVARAPYLGERRRRPNRWRACATWCLGVAGHPLRSLTRRSYCDLCPSSG